MQLIDAFLKITFHTSPLLVTQQRSAFSLIDLPHLLIITDRGNQVPGSHLPQPNVA